MTSRYTVSVAMATYNGARYIREQLDSILAQTVEFCELIISDDGSTDGTIEIIKEYCEQDDRIRLIFNHGEHDIKSNFLNAFNNCRGDLIAPSDQDDIWYPTKLYNIISNFDDDIDVVNAQDLIQYEDNTQRDDIWYFPDIDESIYVNGLKGHTCVFRRSLLGLYRYSGECSWDYVIAFYCVITKRYKTISDILMIWRRHNSAVTYDANFSSKIASSKLKKWAVVKFVNNIFLCGNSHPTLTAYYNSRCNFISHLLFSCNSIKNVSAIKCYVKVLKYASKQNWHGMFLSGVYSMIGQIMLHKLHHLSLRDKIARLLWAFREPYVQWYYVKDEKFLS